MRRVALVLLGLELLYLLTANSLLHTRAVRAAVESAKGLKLEYGRAYSIWPGRIALRDLRLRFEDYNVQFQLTIEHANVDLSLHELPLRRFHVVTVNADGVTYRLRHKIHSVKDNAERLAAYPRIEGFSDPPIYRGEPSPPITDEAYDLWEVHVENIVAHVTELWILEYRFEGRADASGAFLLRPKRWVQVTPGTIDFHSGSLDAGTRRVAASFAGSISCLVPGFDVRSVPGLEVLRHISARTDLKLLGGRLEFIDLYTSRFGFSIAGPHELEAQISLERGDIMPATRVRVHADSYRTSLGQFELAGQFDATMARELGSERLALHLQASNSTLETDSSGSHGQAPVVSRLLADTAVDANVLRPIKLQDASVAIEATVPDFGWIQGLLGKGNGGLRFGGAGDLELGVRRKPDGSGEGQLSVSVEHASIQSTKGQVRVSGDATARFRIEDEPRRFAQGAVSLNASGADTLLSLVVGPSLQAIAADGLDLGALEATIAFYLSRQLILLELTRARSGSLEARGQLRRSLNGQPRGAMLLSSGALRLGVTLERGRTHVSPLVGPNWLEQTLQSGPTDGS